MNLATNLIGVPAFLPCNAAPRAGSTGSKASTDSTSTFSWHLHNKMLGQSGKGEKTGAKVVQHSVKLQSSGENETETGAVEPVSGNKGLVKIPGGQETQQPTSQGAAQTDLVDIEGLAKADGKEAGQETEAGAENAEAGSPPQETGLTPDEQSILALIAQIVMLGADAASDTVKGDSLPVFSAGVGDVMAESPQAIQQYLSNLMSGESSALSGQWESILRLLLNASEGSAQTDSTGEQLVAALTASTPEPPSINGSGQQPQQLQPAAATEVSIKLVQLINRLEKILQRLESSMPLVPESQAASGIVTDTAAVLPEENKALKRILSQYLQVLKGNAEAVEPENSAASSKTQTVFDPLPTMERLRELIREKTGANQQQQLADCGETTENEAGITASQRPANHQASKSSEENLTQTDSKGSVVILEQVSGKPDGKTVELPVKVPDAVPEQPQSLVKQVIEGMRLIRREARAEMNLQLQPESLGKLSLRVAVENGLVTARLVAESQSVGRLIESSLGQLKQALHEQGLRFDRIEVAVGDSSVQADLGQQTAGQHRNPAAERRVNLPTYFGGSSDEWEYIPVDCPATVERYGTDGQIDFLA